MIRVAFPFDLDSFKSSWDSGPNAGAGTLSGHTTSGCRVPEVSYTGQPATDPWLQQPPDPSWWAVFRDPILTDLERRFAAENLDVQTATIRLAESRFQR